MQHFLSEIDANGIDLGRTFSCGQAFRWRKRDDIWFGSAYGKPLALTERGGKLLLSCDQMEAPFWRRYLGLDRDYGELYRLLESDALTAPCLEVCEGIRVLRQEPFETLITFIVSQNNNVGRIAGIVERMCSVYGDQMRHFGIDYFSFPTREALASATTEELTKLGAGYRAPYIAKTARLALDCDFERLAALPFDEARERLMEFPGVGPKVADCVMLFGLGFGGAFPIDVWMGRAMELLYPGKDCKAAAAAAAGRYGEWAGAAQQYLFHYARVTALGKNAK